MFKKLCPSKRKMNSSSSDRKQVAPPPPTIVNRTASVSTTDESDSVSGDSLEGLMELTVHLPDKKIVTMSVEKRMPMMDLLVHVTTANKITPGGHIIKIVNDEDNGYLSYKPSTPIGSLTSSVIYIVPKKNLEKSSKKDLSKVSTQPFEPTFRLQVHLPRQQLLVLRVSQQTKLSDIHHMVCSQKGLDPSRYHLQHPHNPEIILDYFFCLADYNLNEINMVSKNSMSNNSTLGNENFILRKEHEEKKRKSLFGMFRRTKSNSGDLNNDDKIKRSSSSAYNENHKTMPPSSSRPLSVPNTKATKKRPAPPPPLTKGSGRSERPPPPPPLHSKSSRSLELTHSRHSSDSSGYHDSSVLGDSPEGIIGDPCESNEHVEHLKSISPSKDVPKLTLSSHINGPKVIVHTNLTTPLSTSNSSITTGLKKRRAPLPPQKNSSPTSTKKLESNNGDVQDNNAEPSSSLPLPPSASCGNEENVIPSPSTTPLPSKEYPNVSDDCMKDQNCNVPGWEVNPGESLDVSETHLNEQKIKDHENRITSGIKSSVNTSKEDNSLQCSDLGTEDKESESTSPCIESKSLHELHDNHPSLSLLNVVADDTKHEMDVCVTTSPSKLDNFPLNNETIPPIPLSLQNNPIDLKGSDSTQQSPLNSEKSPKKFINEKFENNMSREITNEDNCMKDIIDVQGEIGHSSDKDITKNYIHYSKEYDGIFIDKENGETTEANIVKDKSEDNDFNVTNSEERLSLSSLSSADEDDLVSSFKEIIKDAGNMIENDEFSMLKDDNLSNKNPQQIKAFNDDLQNKDCDSATGNDASLNYQNVNGTLDKHANKANTDVNEVSDEIVLSSSDNYDKKVSEVLSENNAKRAVRNKRPLMNFSISTYKPRADVTVNESNLIKSESFNANLNEAVSGESFHKPKAVRSSSFEGKFQDSPNEHTRGSDSSRNIILTVKNVEPSGNKLNRKKNQQVENTLNEHHKENGLSFHNTKASSMIELNQDEDFNLRRTRSEFVLNTLPSLEVTTDQPEYMQLQHEYLKLQNQLLYWQQKLLSNQTLLQRQHILPSDAFHLSPEMLSMPMANNAFDYPNLTNETKASTFPKQYEKSKTDQQSFNLSRIGSLNHDFNNKAKENEVKSLQNASSFTSVELKKTKTDELLGTDQSKQVRAAKSDHHLERKRNSLEKKQNPLNSEFVTINQDEAVKKLTKRDNEIVQNFDYTKERNRKESRDDKQSAFNCKVIENETVFKNNQDMTDGTTDSFLSVKDRIQFMERCGKDNSQTVSVDDNNERFQSKNFRLTLSNDKYAAKTTSQKSPVQKVHSFNRLNQNNETVISENCKMESQTNYNQVNNGNKFRRQRVETVECNGKIVDDGFTKCLPQFQSSKKLENGVKSHAPKTVESAFNNKNLNRTVITQTSSHFKEPFTFVNDKKSNSLNRIENPVIIGENNAKRLIDVSPSKRHTTSVKIDNSLGNKTNTEGISIHIRDTSLPNNSASYQTSGRKEGTQEKHRTSNSLNVVQEDPRDALLHAIKNFGGVKSLKRVK